MKKTATTEGTVPKKAATKRIAKVMKPLQAATPGREFRLSDGRVLADLKQLADVLDDMNISVWTHHVTQDRNDFANWINDVFEEPELAKRVRQAATNHHAQVIIYRTILERA